MANNVGNVANGTDDEVDFVVEQILKREMYNDKVSYFLFFHFIH